jgi:tripartite-type tricarboxylate transporter receptor subunit TctC
VLLQLISAELRKALAALEARERFLKFGLEPTSGSSANLQDGTKRYTEHWGRLVKASGFRSD